MATVKDLWKFATTAAVDTSSAYQGGAQQRRVACGQPSRDQYAHALRSSPLDSLDPAASPADHHDYDVYGDSADAPAPALPYFNSAGHSTDSVPCFDVQLAAALELLVLQAQGPDRDTDCEAVHAVDQQAQTPAIDGCEPYIH